MNESKSRDPRMWEKWRRSGALENPLSRYEERFNTIQAEIVEVLRPGRGLIIFSTDSQDAPNGNHLTLDKKGRWTLDFGREGGKELKSPVQFPELLKSYATAKLNDSLFGEVTDDMLDHRISAQDYGRRSREIRLSLERSVEENPIGFAAELLGHMEQALKGYRQNPY